MATLAARLSRGEANVPQRSARDESPPGALLALPPRAPKDVKRCITVAPFDSENVPRQQLLPFRFSGLRTPGDSDTAQHAPRKALGDIPLHCDEAIAPHAETAANEPSVDTLRPKRSESVIASPAHIGQVTTHAIRHDSKTSKMRTRRTAGKHQPIPFKDQGKAVKSASKQTRFGKWTASEDEQLVKAVETCKKIQHKLAWNQVAALVDGRGPKQCRERWMTQLQPGLNTSEWTPEEDENLFELVTTIGRGKWAQVNRLLNTGRSESAIKNRYSRLAHAAGAQPLIFEELADFLNEDSIGADKLDDTVPLAEEEICSQDVANAMRTDGNDLAMVLMTNHVESREEADVAESVGADDLLIMYDL